MLTFSTSYAQDVNEGRSIPEDAIVYMERTQCYGTCPVYKYILFEDGTAQYEGKEYVEKKGSYRSTVSSDKMKEITDLFHEYNFFQYENRYVDHISDLPTTYIFFSDGSQSKKVTDYHGAPESLKKLEKKIDKFMESLEWEKW